MQKKEFFGALLLVSLVSTIMFAGIVLSTGGPSISVYPSTGITASSDVYIYVTGTGWAPGSPVTVYWDQQDANHTIAIMTPSTDGGFRLSNLEIETVPIGPHTIIAVQGLSTATCTYTVTATLPPDETLLGPIQQLENKLDNTQSGLPGIQSNFTSVLNNLTAIEGTLGNTTSGFPGIQSNLTGIQSSLSALTNTPQFAATSNDRTVSGNGVYCSCFTNGTVEFQVYFNMAASAHHTTDGWMIQVTYGSSPTEWIIASGTYATVSSIDMTIVASSLQIVFLNLAAPTPTTAEIVYGVSVLYAPNVQLITTGW